MHLHRFTIGVQFNEKMFRLPSIGGLIIDEVLKLRGSEKKIKASYFTKVSTPVIPSNEYSISLIDDKKSNSLSILPDQFIFKKTSSSDSASVSIDKAINEFQIFWKAVDKIAKFPSVRRIGFVGEFRLEENKTDDAGPNLIKSLTKFSVPGSCERFHLTYEDRDLMTNGKRALTESDDFWNKIFTYYISDSDETLEKGKIYASMDVQRYYSPAKADPVREFNAIKSRFSEDRCKFKTQLNDLGLS